VPKTRTRHRGPVRAIAQFGALASKVGSHMASDQSWAPNETKTGEARGRDGTRAAGSAAGSSGMRAINSQLQAIAEQIDKLNNKHVETAPAFSQSRAEDDDLRAKRRAIEERLADINPASAPSVAYDPAAPLDTDGSDELRLDSAMAEITAWQRTLDGDEGGQSYGAKRGPADLSTSRLATVDLRDRLRELTDDLHNVHRPEGFEDTLFALRQALNEIGQQIESAASRRSLNLLESAMREIAVRMERERRHSVDPAALSNIERSLDELRKSLAGFTPAERLAVFHDDVETLSRKIDALAAPSGDYVENGSLKHIERAIDSLREIVSRAATGDALVALADEIRNLDAKIDRIGERATANAPEPVAASETSGDVASLLNARFDALTAYLDERANQGPGSHERDLSQAVETLATKLDGVEIGQQHAPVLQAIATQLDRVVERLDASDARFDNVAQFESALAGVLENVRELCAGTVSAAERAVERATRDAAYGDGSGLTADVLRDLDAIRRDHATSDRRTQDTLETVHRTLEQLVERLSALETDVGAQDNISPVPGARLRAAQGFRFGEAASGDAPRPLPRNPEPPRGEAAEHRPIDPTLPADHPIEPGRPPVPPVLTAAQRIAASEAALGPAKPVAEAEAKSNFIAAARRAAQAAASMNPPSDTRAGEPPAQSSFGTFAKRLTGRRPLMLALVTLLSTGTLAALVHEFGDRRIGRAEAPAIMVSAPIEKSQSRASASAARETPDGPGVPPAVSLTTLGGPGQAPLSIGATAQAAAGSTHALTPPVASGTPTVSALTIASIALPSAEVTGSVGRATGVIRKPDQATATVQELPAGMGPLLRKAAQSGDAAAAYEVGLRYAEGRGVTLNFEEAARWFQRSAAQDVTPAQYRLANLYEKGQGVKKDIGEARRLYQVAADKGHAKAMHNLAVIHAEGSEGKPDFRVAAEWFRQAALRGVADSQYNLGILYARGLGLEQSLSESYIWFSLAALSGDRDAGNKRDDVAKRLSADALATAKRTVETFKPQPQPEEATTVKTPPGGWDAAVGQAPAKPAAAKTRTASPRRTGTT
jgi:localization factor PodJL